MLSAQYRRAYVQSLPTYTAADNYLANAAIMLGGVVEAACMAVGSSERDDFTSRRKWLGVLASGDKS